MGKKEKTFLIIRIKENERNALSFYWIKNCDPNIVEVNRFVILAVGLNESPFISTTF